MLWKLLIWCVSAVASWIAPEPPEAAYTLTLEQGADANPRVIVVLRCKGDPDRSTELELRPEWGGHTNDGSDVTDLSVTGKDGRALAVDRRQPWAWSAMHEPGEPLIVRYVINPTPPRGDASHGNDYRTRLDSEHFQCIANLALLLPKHLDDEQPRNFSMELAGFERAGWQVMSSWGKGEGVFPQRAPSGDFLHSLVIAAAPDAGRFHTRSVSGNTVGVAILGDDWGFEDGPFIDLATQIITIEREFFADHTDPWFLITLTPEGGRAQNGAFSLGGTGLRNCFALYCNTGLSLEPGSPYAERIALLLAHEYFHTWNGLKLRVDSQDGEEREGSGYWFSEGFTNFYARRLLHNAGLIDDRAYARNLSEALAAYDANPYKNAPNGKIRDEFWKNQDVGQLPYQRGDLIALAIDERLRAASRGLGDLDDLIRHLLAKAKDDPNLTTDNVLALIEESLGVEFAAAIRSAVIDGGDVPVPETTTRPNLRLTTRECRVFDPGLNTDASQKAGVVIGVRDGGEAFNAGLRNGQKLMAFSINAAGPDANTPPKAVVNVEIEGQSRTIEYEAISEPRRARAYEPK
jgi:predicted metalloprotease with PDZ domain